GRRVTLNPEDGPFQKVRSMPHGSGVLVERKRDFWSHHRRGEPVVGERKGAMGNIARLDLTSSSSFGRLTRFRRCGSPVLWAVSPSLPGGGTYVDAASGRPHSCQLPIC